jgi:hypothetical protein
MLAEFENRLADVLSQRLPAPFTGTVDRAPGRDIARLLVAITSAEPIADNLLSVRPERVPGDIAPRRVLRLRCDVALATRADDDRTARMQAIDAALYLLGEPAFESGMALLPADATDPGFQISRMLVTNIEAPLTVKLQADGLFWPVGIAGQVDDPIQAILIQMPLLPLRLTPERPALAPGGPPVDLVLNAANAGGGRIAAAGIAPTGATALIVRLIDAGGRPGAGSLSGGVPLPGGSHRVALANGAATLTYTPPAAAAFDLLVVALDGDGGAGDGRPGIELARFALATRPKP